jgi:hypothetical protein
MAELPKLTESEVQSWIGELSFGRGQTYYRRDHILNPRWQGEAIKGRCLGSQARPYELNIRLGTAGIVKRLVPLLPYPVSGTTLLPQLGAQPASPGQGLVLLGGNSLSQNQRLPPWRLISR